MSLELTEALLAKAAGWEAMKRARAYLEADQVLSSTWEPPTLRGMVQDGSVSYRTGLIIKSPTNIENLCSCRPSREWGTICGHTVAAGLHWLQSQSTPAPGQAPSGSTRKVSSASEPIRGPRLRRTDDGEPAELFVVLPPNLEEAIRRGRIMVCLEAQSGAGRKPLDALPKSKAFRFDTQDAALLDHIEALAGDTAGMLQLGSEPFAEFLQKLIGHPRVSAGRNAKITVSSEPWLPRVKAALQSNGELTLEWKDQAHAPVTLNTWVFASGTFRPFGLTGRIRDLLRGSISVPRPEVPQFLSRDWPPLLAGTEAEANFQLADFEMEQLQPRFALDLRGGLAHLEARLEALYGGRSSKPDSAPSGGEVRTEEVPQKRIVIGLADETGFWMPDPASPTRYWTRDLTAERAALSRLLRAGFGGPDREGRYQLRGEDAVLSFFARDFSRLQKEWVVSLEERLDRSTKQKMERIEPRFEVRSSGIQWFDLSVHYQASGGEEMPAAEIQRLLRSGQSHTRLRNGKLAVIDTGAVEELQEVLLDCEPEQHAGSYRLPQTQAGYLESTLRDQGWRVRGPQNWVERARQQSGEIAPPCPPLGPLETVLRPYQKAGVAWMQFLRANGFGGILADEMGLGKTLQTLALLQAVRASHEPARPWLVICPTSLVFNWLEEAGKFVPSLKALALSGPQRSEEFVRIPESDLVITSYALIRRDLERYRGLEFDTVVLDEAQHIKNRETQNAQAVKAICGRHRLVLTGTPLENSVLDLWSIFDFLMPGYLGHARDFRERYELPITRDRNPDAQARLARRLRPFMLRRLKRDVASDLPERLEQVLFCNLTNAQRRLYGQLLEAGRKEVLDQAGAQGLARSRMLVLTTLLRLRQACCDLRLLNLENVDAAESSAKLDLFGELIEEVLDGGHRVLVFSQFVSMLTLLREKLEAEQIKYCYLDGSTPNRAEVVRRFQGQADIPVFLISLKAGGVGLNLTGADTVIHFDPWWNPAVEAQATDRAHRIGQTRVVTSYKLISRDTIEEKILKLQERKRDLIRGALGAEEALAETLNWEEIQELLA